MKHYAIFTYPTNLKAHCPSCSWVSCLIKMNCLWVQNHISFIYQGYHCLVYIFEFYDIKCNYRLQMILVTLNFYYIPDPTTFKHYKNQFVRSIENSNVVISLETLDLMGKITALFSFPNKECFNSIDIKFKWYKNCEILKFLMRSLKGKSYHFLCWICVKYSLSIQNSVSFFIENFMIL